MPIFEKWNPLWIKQVSVLDRRIGVWYLIIPDLVVAQLGEQFEVRPDERFYGVLNEHVRAYMEDGKMPPDMLMSAVMNVADDVLAGRDVVLRAGDYITVQNYVREYK